MPANKTILAIDIALSCLLQRALVMASPLNFTVLFILCTTLLYCLFGKAEIVKDEIGALRIIAQKLGKRDWDFSADPCSFQGLSCACFAVNNICHVTNITLPSQNLMGVLPPELANLSHLVGLDLEDNYLTGRIPPAFGSLKSLNSMNLSRNLLSGPVPKELGDLTHLLILKIHSNNLSGTLPLEIGKLKMLEKLHLSSNGFIQEIPSTIFDLQNLTEFWASGNNFTGKIPSGIGNFTKLKKLRLQGTSLEGPIPENISNLNSLEDLRISDITKGGNMSLDFIPKLKNLKILVLRNNNITATIPEGIDQLIKLETLDLSFNNLHGIIPDSLKLVPFQFLFLGNNSLTGNLSSWLSTSKATIDLSYNYLVGDMPSDWSSKVNLIWNSLNTTKHRTLVDCLQRNLPCHKETPNYGMAINCGGKKLKISAPNFIFDDFDEDVADLGNQLFSDGPQERWGVSNVGYFMVDGYQAKTQYIAEVDAAFMNDTNSSVVVTSDIVPQLYKTARISPISLRYYGLGLQSGKYSIELHFAEIQIPNTNTSKGVRIFDVYIQGKRELQDFNIKEEAGEQNLVVVKHFTVNVTQNILEIHFFWAGKGTCCEPEDGTYGPLVSAIIVTPNFKPHTPKNTKTIKIVVVVVVVVVILGLLLTLYLVFLRRRKMWDRIVSFLSKDKEMKTMEGNSFRLRTMKFATKNFDPRNKIGEGGFGTVYKGVLPDGRKVAIKQLSSQSKQGNREFLNEVGTISAVQHPDLVKLYGCCVEGEELLLVYEYMENGNLARALFGPDEPQTKLSWPTRYRICVRVARGLAYLHEESLLKIVHRDIKSTNILLDKDLNPKVADFGLARLFDDENTHVTTRVAGTIGYMAPEYALKGHLTDKADVYSFGVVVLEIVSGRTHTDMNLEEERAYLLEWAWQLYEEKRMLELVDINLLHSGYNEEEVVRVIYVGLLCTDENPSRRPTMSAVVDMLEGKIETPAPQSRPGYLNHWQTWELAAGVRHDQTQSSTNKSSIHQGSWKESSSSSKADSHGLE